MSLVVRKPVFRVSDQVRPKRSAQQQKMARDLKFQIEEVEGFYYPCGGGVRVLRLTNS